MADNASVRGRVEALVQIGDREWLAFDDPERIVQADNVDAVRAAIADVERLTRDFGFHAVGFVTYEAGAAFGLKVKSSVTDLPLVWFALFEPSHVRSVINPVPISPLGYTIDGLTASVDRPAFQAAFDRIKQLLADGDTYQVNYTFKMTGRFAGDPRSLFADLTAVQQGRHSAFLHLGDWSICSASPELFFALDGLAVASRPMKGTVRRGRTTEEDRRQRADLHGSVKQRAENVMIVDMVRSDLGRIAQVGSVTVPELFTVERYPTLWQMTSLVTARSTASLDDIFAALHPAASVTGAPKVRTMEIVSELEPAPRGVYTGAIGHVWPNGNARFNVAIRTAVIDHRASTVAFGIGSGIVWDSDAAAEYDECLLKGAVLGQRPIPFDLLETLRWSPSGGFFLLERHLNRLADAADYFGRQLNIEQVRTALAAAVAGASGTLRVRLLVHEDGRIRIEHGPLAASRSPMTIALAREPLDTDDVFLFHKTTNRAVYDLARVDGCDETVLWNRRGEVTEGLMTNIVVEIEGRKVTPPVSCGLLAGTYRAELLSRGEIEEGLITISTLRSAARIWLINSVHESREALFSS